VINVLAGGGSFLTLPLLLFLGYPATEANATNRVGVLAQNLVAVVAFHRHKALDRAWALRALLPTLAGASGGAWLALHVADRDFRRLLSFFMLAFTLWTLVDPMARLRGKRPRDPLPPWLIAAGFFLVGLYGGFIQAGVGFLAIALTTLAGLDLVRGSAVKVLAILFQTLAALVIFAAGGKVLWVPGLALAFGSCAGSLLGVRLAVRKGHAWLQRVVTAAVVVFAVLLWFS
jgi:uncharacterized membrane protein YfcA